MSYTRCIPGYYANERYTPTKADEIFNGLSAGKVKEEVSSLIRDEEKAKAKAALPDEIDKFLALHPEFDNDEKDHNPNGAIVNIEMKLRGIDPTTATAQDFRDSYNRLKAAGVPLRLKQDVVRKQREEKNRKDADDIKAREHFDESEAYSMDMDELRRRAGGWIL
jgi:hypothetical protein